VVICRPRATADVYVRAFNDYMGPRQAVERLRCDLDIGAKEQDWMRLHGRELGLQGLNRRVLVRDLGLQRGHRRLERCDRCLERREIPKRRWVPLVPFIPLGPLGTLRPLQPLWARVTLQPLWPNWPLWPGRPSVTLGSEEFPRGRVPWLGLIAVLDAEPGLASESKSS
jgi:hypothetical protein